MIDFDEDSPIDIQRVKEFKMKRELKKINEFENICIKYTTKGVTYRQIKDFLYRMKREYFDEGKVFWSEKEKVWKLELLMKYFPEFKKELDEYGAKTEDSRKRKAAKKLKEEKVEINPKYNMRNKEETFTK